MTQGDIPGRRWLDQAAGPLIRPYAIVGGRTRPRGERFNLISMVAVSKRAAPDPRMLDPEPAEIIRLCQITPRSVADLGAELRLPVGVVCVLLSDLREQGFVMIRHPTPVAQLPDTRILRRIADGLRRL